MPAKRPRLDIPWDGCSDQPARLVDRDAKRRLRWHAFGEYAKTACTAMAFAPLVAHRYWTLAAEEPERNRTPATDFIGLAVSPDLDGAMPHASDRVLQELVAELGVRHLLVRVPVWHRDRLERYADFIAGFAGCEVLVAVLQDRDSVCRPGQWQADLRAIFTRLSGVATAFQVGQAGNRAKWGCLHFGEFAGLLETAHAMRDGFPGLKLVGPSLIDFEPLVMLRSLVNLRRYRLDAVSALLYVDRRGAPGNPQYGVFDLERKIRLQATLARMSPRVAHRDRARLWITETNWPLRGTAPYAPTSESECVDEDAYADYLRAYLQQAYATNLVERVYWWQLVATGYGLVDPREGRLRKRPGFEVFRRMVRGAIALGR